MSVLKTVKSIQPMINKMMEDFEAFIPRDGGRYKSGGAVMGIIKTDVEINNSKQIYRGSYFELPALMKNKKACVNTKIFLVVKKI